jgi:hypothetical protein
MQVVFSRANTYPPPLNQTVFTGKDNPNLFRPQAQGLWPPLLHTRDNRPSLPPLSGQAPVWGFGTRGRLEFCTTHR